MDRRKLGDRGRWTSRSMGRSQIVRDKWTSVPLDLVRRSTAVNLAYRNGPELYPVLTSGLSSIHLSPKVRIRREGGVDRWVTMDGGLVFISVR